MLGKEEKCLVQREGGGEGFSFWGERKSSPNAQVVGTRISKVRKGRKRDIA